MPVCAICTATVATCVGLSRYLGVDDTISGVWIGACLVSLVSWIVHFLNKKNIRFKFRKIIVASLTYFFVLYPLFFFKIIGHPLNKYRYLKIDKLVFGTLSGSLVFLLSQIIINRRRFFRFQKVVIPAFFLLILSLYFYKTC